MTQVHIAEGTNEFELVRLVATQSSQCCSSYVTTNIMSFDLQPVHALYTLLM